MVALLTREQAVGQVEGLGVKARTIPVSKLDARVDGRGQVLLMVEDQQMPLASSDARTNLSWYLGVNTKSFTDYVDDPDLTKRMVQHSLSKRKDKKVVIVSNKEGIQTIYDEAYPWLAPVDTLVQSIDAIGDSFQGVESIRALPARVDFRLVTKMVATPPRLIDDVSHAGVWVRSNGAVEVGSYVLRLACTNGALRAYERIGAKSKDAILAAIPLRIQAAYQDSRDMLMEFVGREDHPAENPTAMINQLVRNAGQGSKRLQVLIDAMPTLPDRPTQYDVINMITAQAHNDGLSDAFEWMGGQSIREFMASSCTHCGTHIR